MIVRPSLIFCMSIIIISIKASYLEDPINSLKETIEKSMIEYAHHVGKIESFVCILFSLNVVCQIFIISLAIMYYYRR